MALKMQNLRGWSSKKAHELVTVPTHTFRIDCGIMIPQMDEFFTAPFSIQCVDMTSRMGTRMRVFYQLAVGSPRISPSTTELLVFEKHGVQIKSMDSWEDGADDIDSIVGQFFALPTFNFGNKPFMTNVLSHTSFMEKRPILGYYFGTDHPPGTMVIQVTIFHIRNGKDLFIAVPMFDAVFGIGTKVKSKEISHHNCRADMRLYYHGPRKSRYGCLVFRLNGSELQSLYSHYEEEVATAITTYAQ
ncbi:hypothetical protein HWV62_8853 [Athelia sp. TMB]|nr:hypothetical protein HWV62_8853 [Athelia sp. TMB]